MIVFVDEDIGDFHPFSLALEMQSFVVERLPDASRGLSRLSLISPGDVDLVFIDVMLARGTDGAGLIESSSSQDGLQTGLRLLERLVEVNPRVFPTKAVLLSAADDEDLLVAIEIVAQRHGVPFWRKTRFASTSHFVSEVVEYLRELPDE